jgi:hypothetical protein
MTVVMIATEPARLLLMIVFTTATEPVQLSLMTAVVPLLEYSTTVTAKVRANSKQTVHIYAMTLRQ